MSGHTPGPWQTGLQLAEKSHDMHRMVYCDDSLGSRVADCSTAGHGISSAQQMANARLIAAAPQLLDALQLAREWIMEARTMTALPSGATLASIHATIAAATGDGAT